MNTAHIKDSERGDGFVNLVDFKWLMSGVGWWVDLSRLQNDRAYIAKCLERALGSDSELLRKCSFELLGLRSNSEERGDTAMPVCALTRRPRRGLPVSP